MDDGVAGHRDYSELSTPPTWTPMIGRERRAITDRDKDWLKRVLVDLGFNLLQIVDISLLVMHLLCAE